MIVEEVKNSVKATDPWQQAWNAATAMNISATRIVFKQMELAALTTQFMNQRLSGPVSLSPDRRAPRRDERARATKAKARGTNGAKRARPRRQTAAH
jgi:hypothetical protein